MKISLFLLTIFLTGMAHGKCFRSHMLEAIELNSQRLDRYAKLTSGGSRKVSKLMIRTERRMVLGSYVLDFDSLSRDYERAGISITCDAYSSMDLVPEFRDQFPNGPVPPDHVFEISSLKIEARLRRAFQSSDQEQILLESLKVLKDLDAEHRLYCMTRHLVESVARIAAFIPIHQEQAREKGLPDPAFLHRLMIRGHLVLLERTQEIDLLARPFNTQGIPLICQDVPPVPLPGL